MNMEPWAGPEIHKLSPQRNRKRMQQDDEQKSELFKKRNAETVAATRYILKGYRFLGVYMPTNHKFLYVLWSIIVNTLATIYFPVAFFISFLFMSIREIGMGNFLTALQAWINDLACTAKITSMAFLLPKLLTCNSLFYTLDQRCHTEEEMKAIKDCIKNCNRIVTLFGIFNGCYTTSTCLSAVVFHRLPYNLYNPLVDATASEFNFYLAVLIEYILVNLAIVQQTFDDSYPVVYVNILRTHLRILLKKIDNLNRNSSESLEANLEELKRCIIDHKTILQIYNIIAPVISTTIFIQFTVTAAILCTILINILIFATDFAAIAASCIYVMVVIGETFPLCYYAQSLMDESSCLSDRLFHSNWVDQSVQYRKMLIFFIQRSQRIIEFSAGKLIPITLSSFLSIAKFSFSLYTFINKMGLKEKFAN